MAYMQGSKRARMTASIINNQKCNLGGNKKNGTVSMLGRNANLRNAITNQTNYCCPIPLGCLDGMKYLLSKNLISKNPASSGGIGRRY